MTTSFHPELRQLRKTLQEIYTASAHFRPLSLKPPILDSSVEISNESSDDSPWTHNEQVPGLRQLRETIRLDLEALDRFLDDVSSASLPPLSTNAPYLIAVWNELVCARKPVVGVFKMIDVKPMNEENGSAKSSGKKIPSVKVDIVAENGRRWIRVNTIKNARILAEFREIDSYLTDGDSDSEDDEMPPTLAQKEFDNSILRMGRLLVQAAKANPIEGTSEIPRITMRLTRLTPFASLEDSDGSDPRIAETVDLLRAMGIDVELGERNSDGIMARLPVPSAAPVPSRSFQPTRRVVLDLSSLIALISDLTHFALPATAEEIYTRFIPPQEYRDWKESRIEHKKPQDKVPKFSPERTIEDLPKVYVKQARALTRQLLQETSRGMIQEIHDQLVQVTDGDLSSVEFWTTPEARSRCLLIVNKIGGANEKRRVAALLNHGEDLQDGIQSYWKGSRYLSQYIPLLPLKYFPSSSEPTWMSGQDTYNKHKLSPFSRILKQTCEQILAQEVIPDPRTIDGTDHAQDQQDDGDWEIQRAVVTKANPRLTAHTVQSMLWGAELGWTVLTGNKSSVKAILREIRAASLSGRLKEEDVNLCAATNTGQEGEEKAAIWVVDPRSLAEGMSSLPSTE